jgi:hypothetical protein
MGPKKKAAGPGGPKPGTKQAKAAAEKAAEKKPVVEEPKKPTVKEVIGGASWTGKLPVNMLSEHCQKQKWEKPEYSMVIELIRMALFCGYHEMRAIADYEGLATPDSNPRRLCVGSDTEENRSEDKGIDCSSSHEITADA